MNVTMSEKAMNRSKNRGIIGQVLKPLALAVPIAMGIALSSSAFAISASSSSDDGNIANNTLDGSLSTRWSAEGEGEFITYDLGTSAVVDDVKIAFFKGDQRDATIEIQMSSDNNSWTTVFFGEQDKSTVKLQKINVTDTLGRFVRVVGFGNTSNSWNSITEIQFIDTSGNVIGGSSPTPTPIQTPTPVQTPTPSPTQTPAPVPTPAPVTSLSVTSSSDDGNVAENTLDNDLSTRWSAEGEGQFIQYDMGNAAVVNSLDIAFFKGDERTTSLDILVSPNGNDWVTAFSGEQPSRTSSLQEIDIVNTLGRFVRIVGQGNSSNDWNSLLEVDINTGGNVETPAPTPAPTPTPTPVTPTPTGDLNANLPPSRNFDLSEWNLGVPEDSDGNGRSDTIQADELNEGFENDFFQTGNDGGLVFKNFVTGPKTSSGTSYTRSELREIIGGDEDEGDTEVGPVNWVFGTAPLSDRRISGGVDGTLDATLAVNHVTTTGSSSQVGRTIIGQIHATDDEPCRLYYRKLPGNELGSIYFAHEPITGSEFETILIGSDSSSASNPSDGIALDEVFSYQIKVVGNDLTVTIFREGKPDVSKTVDMSDSGYDEGGQYMYFKAGVYTQNNTGDDDDFDQATFYSLDARH